MNRLDMRLSQVDFSSKGSSTAGSKGGLPVGRAVRATQGHQRKRQPPQSTLARQPSNTPSETGEAYSSIRHQPPTLLTLLTCARCKILIPPRHLFERLSGEGLVKNPARRKVLGTTPVDQAEDFGDFRDRLLRERKIVEEEIAHETAELQEIKARLVALAAKEQRSRDFIAHKSEKRDELTDLIKEADRLHKGEEGARAALMHQVATRTGVSKFAPQANKLFLGSDGRFHESSHTHDDMFHPQEAEHHRASGPGLASTDWRDLLTREKPKAYCFEDGFERMKQAGRRYEMSSLGAHGWGASLGRGPEAGIAYSKKGPSTALVQPTVLLCRDGTCGTCAMCRPERAPVDDRDLDNFSEESWEGELDHQEREVVLEWGEGEQLGFDIDQWGGLFVSGMKEGAYVGELEEDFEVGQPNRERIDPHEELAWCMQIMSVNGQDCEKWSSEQVIEAIAAAKRPMRVAFAEGTRCPDIKQLGVGCEPYREVLSDGKPVHDPTQVLAKTVCFYHLVDGAFGLSLKTRTGTSGAMLAEAKRDNHIEAGLEAGMTLMAVNGKRVDADHFEAVIELCTKAKRPCKLVFQEDVELNKLNLNTEELYQEGEKLFEELAEGGVLDRDKCLERYGKKAHFMKDLFLKSAKEVNQSAFMAFLKAAWQKQENAAGDQNGNRGGGDSWLHNQIDTLRKGCSHV